MHEIEKSKKAADEVTAKATDFAGYTLDELRYQRALVALQKEFCLSKVMRSVNNLQKMNPFTPSGAVATLTGNAGGWASKILSGLNYLDYAMIGFSAFGTVRKIFRFFKR